MLRARAVHQSGSRREGPRTGGLAGPHAQRASLDQAIADLLEGEPLPVIDPAALLRHCRVHGVSALVAAALSEQGLKLAGTPGLREALIGHELYARLHHERLGDVLDALADERIECLLLKGTPVAQLYYPSPALRSRGDTDLLVHPADFDRAGAVLEALGHDRELEAGGTLRSYQASFARVDGVGCRHLFDVHRRISNRQVFAKAFSWRELWESSIALPDIHRHARTLAPVHLLLHACLHRVAHMDSPYRVDGIEHRGDRLVWLLDIALIARSLSATEWSRLAELAREKAMAEVLRNGLEHAGERFPFEVPTDVITRLRNVQGEPSARLLAPTGAAVLFEDFRSLDGWRPRLQLLRELVLPSPTYMLERYGARTRLMLPWLYLRRTASGCLKLLGS